jgi:hypothetical protein
MNNFKSLLLGAAAVTMFATSAHAGSHSNKATAEIGHKNGAFYAASKDGNYTAYTGLQIQFQSNSAFTEDDFTTGGVDDTHAFIHRRFFASLKGRAGSPKLTYGISFNLEGGSFIEGKVNYAYSPMLNFEFGNHKSNSISFGNRTSSSNSWAVEDPNGFGDVGMGRNMGFGIHGKTPIKGLTYATKISQGGASTVETGTDGIMLNAGLVYEPMGKFGTTNAPDYSAKATLRTVFATGYQYGQDVAGVAGSAAAYAAAAEGATANTDIYHVAAGFKYAGMGLMASYENALMQSRSFEAASAENGQHAHAFLAAASYMLVPNKIPLSVTYSFIDEDTKNGASGDINGGSVVSGGIVREVAVGVAYLIKGTKNKVHASWTRADTQVDSDDVSAANGSGSANNSNDSIAHTVALRWNLTF